MRWFIHPAVLFFVLTLLPMLRAAGQDFVVETSVFDLAQKTAQPNGRPPVVSRSSTYFHAGKVYDSIDNFGEIQIFEPTHSRFTLLSTTRMIAARGDFGQLKHKMGIAERVMLENIEELLELQDPAALQLVDSLRAQLDSNLDESFDAASRTLKLENNQIKYEVRCADLPSPESVDVYLRYADWQARLNYVMNLQLYPAARLALNESLRKRKQMPIQVVLQTTINPPRHLKAEHKIHWKLSDRDRTQIGRWEKLLSDPAMNYVSLQEYQRTLVLANQPKNGRR